MEVAPQVKASNDQLSTIDHRTVGSPKKTQAALVQVLGVCFKKMLRVFSVALVSDRMFISIRSLLQARSIKRRGTSNRVNILYQTLRLEHL